MGSRSLKDEPLRRALSNPKFRRFDASFLLSLSVSICSVVALSFLAISLLQRSKIKFSPIVDVRFLHSQSVLSTADEIKPISDISKVADEPSSKNTVLYGYLVNLKEICASISALKASGDQNKASGDQNFNKEQDTAAGKEKILLLKTGEKTTVGRERIGPKTCELVQRLGDESKLFEASDNPISIFSETQKQFVSIEKKDH